MQRRDRAGFTLLEVIVALAVGGAVLVAVRALLDVLGVHVQRTVAGASAADRVVGTEWIARASVGQLSVRADTSIAFRGDAHEATWSSWCDHAGGWQEPCVVRVTVAPSNAAVRVTLVLSPGGEIVLADGLRVAGLRYLGDATAGGRWSSRWPPSLIPPLALGIVMNDDTLVARVGERR